MDLLSSLVTAFFTVFIIVLLSLVLFIRHMSRYFSMFEAMGIRGPKPRLALGNMPDMVRDGMIGFQLCMYNYYENEKVYAVHEPGRAFLVVRDLDMIRDISIKNFSSFVNRRVFFDVEPFGRGMESLKDEHWKRVRNFVSPAFSTRKLKLMSGHVEDSVNTLLSNLRQSSEEGKPVELKDIMSYFSMDVIASTGFGIKINSFKEKDHPFVTEAQKVNNGFSRFIVAVIVFSPTLAKLLTNMGIGSFPKKSALYFKSFVDNVIANRSEEETSAKRQDFLQLLINAEGEKNLDENDSTGKMALSRKDIQGTSFTFIRASYDNISNVVSFTLFLLAHHLECCRKAQEELDRVTGGNFPTYEEIQKLTYLDMCMNESIRLFPSGYVYDRECKEDCTVQGIHIPKGVFVMVPVMGVHHDRKLWPDPEKFDPERFSPEQIEIRHPFAYLGFGHGPRNCIGKRLSEVQVKMALASILQEMTPVPCEKSVYPVTLMPNHMRAVDGLWVKFVPRKNKNIETEKKGM